MFSLCLVLTLLQEAWLFQDFLLGFSGGVWVLLLWYTSICKYDSLLQSYLISRYTNTCCLYCMLWYFRKVLQERNEGANSLYFRIYVLVLGVYAGLRLVLALFMKIPACHTFSEMTDQSFFQFFKWIYQAWVLNNVELVLRLFQSLWLIHWLNMQERYFVGRGLVEKSTDYIRCLIFFEMHCHFSLPWFSYITPIFLCTQTTN